MEDKDRILDYQPDADDHVVLQRLACLGYINSSETKERAIVQHLYAEGFVESHECFRGKTPDVYGRPSLKAYSQFPYLLRLTPEPRTVAMKALKHLEVLRSIIRHLRHFRKNDSRKSSESS